MDRWDDSDQTGGYTGRSGRVIQTKWAGYSDQTGGVPMDGVFAAARGKIEPDEGV
jgi:hypothetical protein